MDENFFNNELVLIPLNQWEYHCLLVAGLLQCKKVVVYDSLNNNGHVQICKNISKFLSKFSDIHACTCLISKWSFSFSLDIPKQKKKILIVVFTHVFTHFRL